MKKFQLFIAAVGLTLSLSAINVQAQCPIVPFAVVELFTSQGCSYCPAADVALNTVIAAEKTSGRNVICIAEHVTYWNSQWFDPFSDAQFSPRQTVYCQYMGVQKGTPEAFVNGKMVITPSPTVSSINSAINTQIAKAATAGVCLTLQSGANDPALNVSYDLSGAYAGNNLIVCLVEDNLVSKPNNGENAGATLNESGVSRVFKVTSISNATGTVSITPPANCVRANSQLVAYVQNPTTMAIYGATRGVDLGTATTGMQETADLSGINIYPNPATSFVTVAGKSNANVRYSISNVLGEEIKSGIIASNSTDFNERISVVDLSNGMYFLKVLHGDTSITKMLNKQ